MKNFSVWSPEPEPPGAASFCLEAEPTQVGRSRSRLWDLGHPEPPKKVAAPQHWELVVSKLLAGARSFTSFEIRIYLDSENFAGARFDMITKAPLMHEHVLLLFKVVLIIVL